MMPGGKFEIRQSRDRDGVRVAVVGELDLGTSAELRDLLERLRRERVAVRLDLAEVTFIDSTGIQVLIVAVNKSREAGHAFEIGGDVRPQVRRLLELTGVGWIVGVRRADG
jgi:anti-sigma B factor antagonist